mmetsp:Transcript_47712/g.104085  ORF Transcript_47712/g.104085 Transcript_47712/m.104085 type:complete len:667 (-) Transcript_47712:99-2099(-)
MELAVRPSTCSASGCLCAGQLGRRLDLVEAKVLSHWHEFLLYKSEAQRKFEDLFARRRGRSVNGTEVDRRLEKLEESQAECFDVKLAEVRSCCEESRLDLERHWNRQAQEVQNIQGRSEQRLEQRLEQRGDQLQSFFAGQVAELHRELRDSVQGQEKRLRQGNDEMLRLTESVTQQVLAAESRAEQQMSRLRSELELAEAASQDACARNATEITRAVTASECALKPRLQQAQAAARAAVTCLEISVEKRMKCWASEAAEEGRQAQHGRERLEELQEAVAQLELLLQKHGAQISEQSQSSEARDVSFERRFKSQGQQFEDLERSISQLRREVAERTDAIESRLTSEVSGCKDELQERLGKIGRQEVAASREAKEAQAAAAQALREACEVKSAQQELEYSLNESQERLSCISSVTTSTQDAMTSFKKELAALLDSQKQLQQSVASVQNSEAFDGKALRGKLLEEFSQAQLGMRSLGQRISSVETACAAADRSAATLKAEAAQLRLETEDLAKRRAAQALQSEKVEAELSQRLSQVERSIKSQGTGDGTSTQKLVNLAQQVETLRASSVASEGLFTELKTTIMRVEDLQAQVNRLARESRKGSDKIEGALSRLQETEKAMERVAKARESSELWREVRELRSQLSDVRLQNLVRSPRSCEITRPLGWLEP